jgi:hypothetical protein
MRLIKPETVRPPMTVEFSYEEALALRMEIIAAHVSPDPDSEEVLSKLWGLIDQYEEEI